jgi:alkaline phosphatase
VENRAEVRAVLEASGKVIAVFNGHLHRNNMWTHNGIPYFTLQSCVEDVSNTGTPSKSYTIVTVEGEKVSVDVRGGDPATFSH